MGEKREREVAPRGVTCDLDVLGLHLERREDVVQSCDGLSELRRELYCGYDSCSGASN